MKDNYYDYIDIAKGIVIILVVMMHSCGFGIFKSYLPSASMALFFVIAGFLQAASNDRKGREKANTFSLIKKRSIRLLQPYCFYSIVFFMIYMGKDILSHTLSKKKVAVEVFGIIYARDSLYPLNSEKELRLLTIMNNTMWFLIAMITVSAFVMLLDSWYRKSKWSASRKNGLLLAGGGVGVLLTWAMTYLSILLPWSMDLVFVCGIFMGAGIVIYRTNFMEKLIKRIELIIINLIIYIVCCSFNHNTNLSMRQFGGNNNLLHIILYLVVGITGSIVWLSFAYYLQGKKVSLIFRKTGRITVLILCTHIMVIYVTDAVINRLHFNMSNMVIYWIVQLIRLALVIGIYIGAGEILKRNKMTSKLL